MIGIKETLKYSLSKIKVIHTLPGRLRLKIPYLNTVPLEYRKYDDKILQGIKILKGIETLTINYDINTVLITYDISILYEKKLISWVNRVIKVGIDNIDLFRNYGETNLNYVINTIENQLRDIVKEYS